MITNLISYRNTLLFTHICSFLHKTVSHTVSFLYPFSKKIPIKRVKIKLF